MLQPLLMVCFLAVFLRDAIGEPWLAPWVTPAQAAITSLSLMAGLALVTHILIWRNGRRLSRTGKSREIRRADLTVGAAWLAATALHIFNILALGWLDAVRSVVGDVIILDEAIALLPVLGVIIAAWWSLYPLDRRVREAGLIRDLDEGRTVYPQLTRSGFVLMAVRHQLAIIFVPILLVMTWSELVDWGAGHWWGIQVRAVGGATDAQALAIVVVQAAGTLTVFTLMPPLMRRVWDTEPLGASRIRERLDALCRRHGVRNRELLVWKTQGTMINGAVMGLFAPVRYIMLTDSLLDHLSEPQVEAVMAHEVGHVRRHHMIWLVVAMIAAIGCIVSLAGLALQLLPLPPSALQWADVPVTFAAIGSALILFGFVSRRFEWQADAFAVQHLSGGGEGSPTVITPDAVAAMTGALQAVADLNHVPPDRFSWRHGSIRARQRRLAGLVGLPADRLPIDHQVRALKIAAAIGLLAVVTLGVAQALLPRYDVAVKFVKMHGIGNDYVYLDAVSEPGLAERADLADLTRAISDRHSGVGSDGLILVCRPNPGVPADVRMRMFNADGSESEMCGNGIRCVAKFAHDRLGIRARPMRVETGRGVLSIDYIVENGKLATATVDMGEPILELQRIPVNEAGLAFRGTGPNWGIETPDRPWICTFVSMGNPHAVIFENGRKDLTVREVRDLDLSHLGPQVEHHAAFPRRINAHWVAPQSRTEATMRTWERGAGTTMACGTGACAVLVAGVLTGRFDREALLHLPGGDLTIRWDEATNHVFKTGPAADVFEGDWPDPRPDRRDYRSSRASDEAAAPVATATLNTNRLILRPFVPSDAPAIAALCHERDIAATTLLIPHPYTLADAERWLATHPDGWASGSTINFAVTLRPGGPLVGAVGLTINRDHSRAELGYWTGKPFWGRGYATEAARAVVKWGFDSLGLERIFAYHFARNAASGRVLKKIGMTPEGLARRQVKKWGEYHDSPLYSILRGEPLGESNAAH